MERKKVFYYIYLAVKWNEMCNGKDESRLKYTLLFRSMDFLRFILLLSIENIAIVHSKTTCTTIICHYNIFKSSVYIFSFFS